MIAVDPSGPAAFGSAFPASKRNAAARSPDSAASSNDVLANAGEDHKKHKRNTRGTSRTLCLLCFCVVPLVFLPRSISDLRENPAAVADRLHRDLVSFEHRQ